MRAFIGWYIYRRKGIGFAQPRLLHKHRRRAAPSNHFLLFRFAPILLSLRSLQQLLQVSCKFCCSRFQGEGVTLKFLSCLNGLLSIWEQLSCLESVFRLLEKRTGWCRGGSAVCIVHLTRNTLSFVVAVCSRRFLKDDLCDNNLLI